jgi:ubiquitin C-terminal hydrolase
VHIDIANTLVIFFRYISKELLTDYRCDSCSAQSTSTHQTTLKQLPPILGMVIKRFDNRGRGEQKVKTPIQFPYQIDMREFTTRGQDVLDEDRGLDVLPALQYTLHAVLTHEGSLTSGHYKTYAKHGRLVSTYLSCAVSDHGITKEFFQWLELDDSCVSKVYVEDVLKMKEQA